MRCYFFRDGHICAVEVLADALSDAEAVRVSADLFRDRFVHRDPPLSPKFGAPKSGGPASRSP